MAEQSSIHPYLNWTKQRIDEMDATLASLEAQAGKAKAESKVKADQLIADLTKRRDEFQAKARAQQEGEGGEEGLLSVPSATTFCVISQYHVKFNSVPWQTAHGKGHGE